MEKKVTPPSPPVNAGIEEGLRKLGASEQEAYVLPGLFFVESSFQSDAKAKTSSAGGLGQFTDPTWKRTIRKLRKAVGDEIADFVKERGKFDPTAGTIAAVQHSRENAEKLDRAGLEKDDPVALYAVHFAGRHGIKLMQALERDAETPLSKVLSKPQQRANPGVMRLGTVGKFAEHFRTKIAAGSEAAARSEIEEQNAAISASLYVGVDEAASPHKPGTDEKSFLARLTLESGTPKFKPLPMSSMTRDEIAAPGALPAMTRAPALTR